MDVRRTKVLTRSETLKKIEKAAAEISHRRGVQLRQERLNVDPPAVSDEKLMQRIVEVCRQTGASHRRMISRAYHDSLFMAQISATAMIFIPCRGGVSHRPDEFASPEAIECGVRVLAGTLAMAASDGAG